MVTFKLAVQLLALPAALASIINPPEDAAVEGVRSLEDRQAPQWLWAGYSNTGCAKPVVTAYGGSGSQSCTNIPSIVSANITLTDGWILTLFEGTHCSVAYLKYTTTASCVNIPFTAVSFTVGTT